MKLASLILLAIISSSCATVVPVQARLQLPPDLVLPTIQSVELQCLTDAAYDRMMLRDIALRARVDTLKDIILSTQQ